MTKQNNTIKRLYIILGWVSVSLGTIGIILPVLPTTPFMLLAAWCFVRSSRRYYKWLMYHPKFGKYLRDYKANRGIPQSIKLKVLGLLWCTMAICIFIIIDNIHIKLFLFGITVAVTTHILTIKTRKQQKSKILILVPTINELYGFQKQKDIIIEHCGVGSIRTALKTTEAINRLDPEWVILCGWAGAYSNSGLHIGQCVSVKTETEADLGTIRDGKFVNIAECDFVNQELYQPQECPFCKESDLTLVTSNTVNKCCAESRGAMIENMEGAGFFHACLNAGVNFMEIRVISNIVGEPIRPEVAKNLNATMSEIVTKLIKK